MGMFSSKTVVTVSTHVSRVIEDASIPDSLKTGTVRSIFTDGQLVEQIMDSALSGIAQKAERMYQFGKREYLYGVPTSNSLVTKSAQQVVKDIIEQSEQKSVSLIYYNYGPINNLHYGWQTLTNEYGYNHFTNELVELYRLKGAPVYLQDLQVVLAESTVSAVNATALEQWDAAATQGYSPTRPEQNGSIFRGQTPTAMDPGSSLDYCRVVIAWVDPVTKTTKTETLSFPIPLSSDEDYYQAKYSYGNTIRYFTYQAGSGTYPVLDTLFSPEYDDIGSFFPFGYFRFNKRSVASNPGSDEYATSNKLMKYLGLNFEQVAKAIEENPDIEHVESALLMMAVPASTSNPLEQRYLFDFFKGLHTQSATVDRPLSIINSEVADAIYGNRPPSAISLVIQDRRFKTVLSMKGIFRKVRYGSIGKVGSYASGSTVIQTTWPIPYVGVITGATFAKDQTTEALYYRKQVTETLYEEYTVLGLQMSYEVTGMMATTATMVPLDHSITTKYHALDREVLYSRSLHYVINSRQEQTIKWYQKGWFRFVLIVVALVITFFSWGSGSGALAAALAAGTAATIQYVVVYMILIPMLIQEAMKLFVKLLGPEIAMVLALVVAVYAGYTIMDAGSVQGAPWAKELLQISSNMIQQVGSSFTEALQGIQAEGMEFGLYADEKMKELESSQKLLETSTLLSPFVIFGETPDEYFNRTVHSGNVGIAGIDAISNYVKGALTLPTVKDTFLFDPLMEG